MFCCRRGPLFDHANAEQLMSMPAVPAHRWTVEEVERLIEEREGCTPRYELVDGELLVSPLAGIGSARPHNEAEAFPAERCARVLDCGWRRRGVRSLASRRCATGDSGRTPDVAAGGRTRALLARCSRVFRRGRGRALIAKAARRLRALEAAMTKGGSNGGL